MQFKQMTVLGLFDSSQKSFTIPVYQRAYSWEKDEWNTFLTDLREQIKGNNNYFYGNLLLETIRKDMIYEVIDGQQRLTTLTIFLRALFDVLKSRQQNNNEALEIDIIEKERIYFKSGGNIKLRPVEYDKPCYDTIIVEGKDNFITNSPSQTRIKEGKSHFIKELKSLKTSELLQILEKIESTELTCIELQGKKDSALMFELQNNRGRELTNMEKLKSYFMYQMYVYSPQDETETNVEHIANIFKLIYLIINDLKHLNEDSILNYHCQAYVKGYSYRSIEDIKDLFKRSKDKVEWIKRFVGELHTSFSNMKKMERSQLKYLQDLRQLSIPAFAYPFFIKGYKFFGEDDEKLNTLFHILEIAVFRYRLINSRADIISRLNEILTSFTGVLDELRNNFKDKFNTAWYWSDYRVKEYLNGWMYENRVLHYLLWKYESAIQRKGYILGTYSIQDIQIEHISPQTPPNGKPFESGYDLNEENHYNDDFVNEYLNCVGNLLLISQSHNASIGNRPFAEKLTSYIENPILIQQAEIKRFVKEEPEPKWNREAIDKRHTAIIEDFAIPKWDFRNVEIK